MRHRQGARGARHKVEDMKARRGGRPPEIDQHRPVAMDDALAQPLKGHLHRREMRRIDPGRRRPRGKARQQHAGADTENARHHRAPGKPFHIAWDRGPWPA
jgi:hypothetical protein